MYLTDVVFVKLDNKAVFIPTNKISHVMLEGRYCRLFVDGEKLTVRSSLKQIETNINNKAFVKIYRSTLLNLNYLKEIHIKDKLVLLTNGVQLSISTRYLDKLVKLYPAFS